MRSPILGANMLGIEELKRAANLTQLDLSEEELVNLLPNLQEAMNMFAKINSLDLSQVNPLVTMDYLNNPDNRTAENISRQELLKNAQSVSGNLVQVPTVI